MTSPLPQDTVVALQALAAFETHQHQGPLSVTASVTAEGLTHSFTVNDDNKLLQQLVTLPTLPTNVTLGMEGQGCAIMQVMPQHHPHHVVRHEAGHAHLATL